MLNVIWCTSVHCENDWETTWIQELLSLGNIEYKIQNFTNHILPNSLIVCNNINYYQYLLEYEKNGIPFGLIHLSDEYLNENYSIIYDFLKTSINFVLSINAFRSARCQH